MMRLQFAVQTVALAVLFTPAVSAQALYLRPDTRTTGNYSLVFSTSPFADSANTASSLGLTAVTAVSEGGKKSQVTVESGDKSVSVKSAADTLFTSADFGVSNRGEGHLVLLRFHTKIQPAGGAAVGLPVELTPKTISDGIAFVATAGGKPLGNTTVIVHEPGSVEPRTVTTDADGLTPTYSKAGRYAARVGRFEKQQGEHEGRAYTGVWEYSTVVTEVK